MTSTIRLSVLGTGLRFHSSDEGLLATIATLWAPFVRPTGPATEADITYQFLDGSPLRQGKPLEGFPDRDSLLGWVCADINRTAIESYDGFAAHAGVVSRGETVVAVPAESGAGKTTFTAACVRAGWDYISDEALCLRYDDAAVVPYPKPLALSAWSAQALRLEAAVGHSGEHLTTSTDLGGRCVDELSGLTDVVVLRRSASATPRLVPRHRAEILQLLLLMSFNHYRRPADAFRVAGTISATCRLWDLEYSDPLEAAAELSAVLG